MSKIYCDESLVNRNVISYLEQAINYLDEATVSINNASGPNQYSGVNQFFSLSQDINNLKSRINKVINWANNSTNRISIYNSNICNEINQLAISKVEKENSIVK